MGKKQKTNCYYESFPALCHYSVECADALMDFFKHFDAAKLEETKTKIHRIEHAADDAKHETMAKLMREFMTPIDREDILELLREIDDITDAVEEVPLKLYIYDYHELPEGTIPFFEVVEECIRKTEDCLAHFPDFENQKVMDPLIREVVLLEEKTDDLYEESMRRLYTTTTDGFARHKGEAIYTMFEETADRCREVCKFVETIMYKNI